MEIVQLESLRQHVISELQQISHRQKGEEIIILCPVHNESTPSCSVHIGFRLTPGSWHCFGCNASGGWGKISRLLGLASFNYGTRVYETKDDPFVLLDRYVKAQKPDNGTYEKLHGIEPLPAGFKWRGYGKRYYESLGGKFWWERNIDIDYEMDWLYFPLMMRSEYRGYTICALKPNKPKYQTFAQTKSTFFLYDQVRDGGSVVLVEGHFDALRLQAEGIPAMAIFGTSNWGPLKRELLAAKLPKKVLILMDGDEPGHAAAQNIFLDLRAGFNVDIMYLPIDGKKLDPGNMPEEFLAKVRSLL